MPDFPTTGGASAASIWAYATRTMTALTGTPRSDLLGSDDSLATIGFTSTRAGYLDLINTNLDDKVSDVAADAAAAVWGSAARTLTHITGDPRTDLLGEDASFASASGARIADLERIKNIPAVEAITEAAKVMTGAEIILVEKTDTLQCYLEGYVDLTPMDAADVIVIRQYMKVKSGGAYVKYAEETYSDAQAIPLLHIATKGSKRSIKVTAQQTAGTNRTLDVQFAVHSQKTAT